jgi:coproporphyrinogen III oxidase-like Fe-S oxidoreductase
LEEQARRNIILGIKCRIDKEVFRKRYGFLPEERFRKTIDRLVGLNLISNTEQEIKLTYAGRLFAEEVGKCFEGSTD